MPRLYRVAFIDDNNKDLKTVPRALGGSGLAVTGLPANVDVAQVASDYDMFMLDFQLVERRTRTTGPTLGTTIASQLRESAPHKPVVLVTTGKLIDSRGLETLVENDSELDDLWDKEELEEDPAAFRNRCTILLEGYAALPGRGSRQEISWSGVCKAVGVGANDVESLAQASPPRIPPAGSCWQVFEAAHWLRYVVLAYPGILYEPLHAACALGISLASFQSSAVAKLFHRALYAGPFAPAQGRWWKSKLRAVALETLGSSGAPLHHFGEIWNAKRPKKLTLSRCCVDRKSIGNCVCHVLRKPVATANSFPYLPDRRPLAVMDEARVSFTAVRERNEFDEDLVPSNSRRLAHEMRVGRPAR